MYYVGDVNHIQGRSFQGKVACIENTHNKGFQNLNLENNYMGCFYISTPQQACIHI